ncbi:MAG: alpha-L-rhamnosidase C-terminal domain-containing protein, partial [Saprospiraceae bacterium]
IYNFDMQAFYRKTIYDWVDAMNDTVFVDTAPFVGINYCGLSWESAFLITQYYLYLYYQDTGIVEELYELDKHWMQKVARIHPDGWVDAGLSDHESLAPVPVKLTGTCHYLQCARIMKTFATLMGDTEKAAAYDTLAGKLQSMIRTEYWDKPVSDPINRQTLFATLLYHEVIPEEQVPAAVDSLRLAVEKAPAGHFITGIFGTKYILEALSRYGSPQLVYDIVNSTAFPGWGYMVDQGATTIWETWKESDNTYSNCHPMFGSVTEWYYRWLGGIRADPEHPGFKSFILAPFMPEGLDSVSCTYQSPFGNIVSHWHRETDHRIIYQISIPEGSSAQIILPYVQARITQIRKLSGNRDLDHVEGLDDRRFTLEGGDYLITISTDD